jgi:hypothetical protein
MAFGAVVVSILQLSLTWAEADIRTLLVTAASSDAQYAPEESENQPTDPA